MGSRCHTISDGYVIEEPLDDFGSFDDTAGITRGGNGYDGFDGGDRGGGEGDEFCDPGELGEPGLGPFAQVPSFVPQILVADGDAPPGFDDLASPLTRGLGAMGRGQVTQSAGSVPLHRQPSAQPGENIDNYPHPDDLASNPWFRGPPLASSLNVNHNSDDAASRPPRGPLGRAGRGTREVNPPTMAGVVGRGCPRAKDDAVSAAARYTPGGAAHPAPPLPREGAFRRDAFPALVGDRTRHCTSRSYDDLGTRTPPRAAPALPVVLDGPRVPIYTARREPPVPRDSDYEPYVEGHRDPYRHERQGTGAVPPPAHRAPTAPGYRSYPPRPRDSVELYDQGNGLNPRVPMHIDSRTALKALNGEFVQLDWFLDNDCGNDYEHVDHNVDSMLRPLRPRRHITSMYKWMEAWGHYEVTLVSSYGLDMYFELASYRSFILSLTDKYKIPFILTYDERHRAALGRARSFDFSYFNNQLFVTIFDVSSLRATTKCSKCASNEHGTKDCPFRGGAPAGGVTTQGSNDKTRAGRQVIDPNEVCIRFQDGSCRFRKCPRKHCCMFCGGPKGAKSCDVCAAKSGAATSLKN